jgi:hypothetical protein
MHERHRLTEPFHDDPTEVRFQPCRPEGDGTAGDYAYPPPTGHEAYGMTGVLRVVP